MKKWLLLSVLLLLVMAQFSANAQTDELPTRASTR